MSECSWICMSLFVCRSWKQKIVFVSLLYFDMLLGNVGPDLKLVQNRLNPKCGGQTERGRKAAGIMSVIMSLQRNVAASSSKSRVSFRKRGWSVSGWSPFPSGLPPRGKFTTSCHTNSPRGTPRTSLVHLTPQSERKSPDAPSPLVFHSRGVSAALHSAAVTLHLLYLTVLFKVSLNLNYLRFNR